MGVLTIMAPNPDFPILDFSKYGTQFESFADDVFKASNQWGFFVLKGTAINNVDRMFQLSHDFFTLPVDEKATKIMNDEAIGYDGTKLTTFAASEGISFGSLPGGILETQNLPSWWDLQKRKEIEAFKAQCLADDLLRRATWLREGLFPKLTFAQSPWEYTEDDQVSATRSIDSWGRYSEAFGAH